MTTKLTLDQSGRVPIPKTLRPKILLKKEHGVWVYQGEPSDASIADVIEHSRESHIRPKSC